MKNNLLENRFKLEEPIAKGVSGGVFRAKDLKTDAVVAVKLLYTPPGADHNFGVRFKREADVLFELSHPHIVKVLHSGVTPDGVIYYAMEFINGVTLERFINARGRLSVWEAADFLEQVASALDVVHAQKIIHRDVTPSNIMIETDAAGRSRAKLIDFGFAKELGMSPTSKGGPATGRLLLGVAAFMSPEVLAGRPATPLSDVHALGVTTTMMLTGKHPFMRDAEVATIAAVLEDLPPPLRSLAPEAEFPAELEALVAQTMAKKPHARPQSAGDFARKFRSIVGVGPSVPAESPSALVKRRKAIDGSTSSVRKAAPAPTNGGSSIIRSGAKDVSPSGRMMFHSPETAQKTPIAQKGIPLQQLPRRQQASWTIPILGTAVLLGGAYALFTLMSS
jgi:eukaryotic-like serine/threonine-protein kinase